MGMTLEERTRLRDAIVEALPSGAALSEIVAVELGKEWVASVAFTGKLELDASRLIEYADSTDQTEALIRAFREANPSSPSLAGFERSYYSSRRRAAQTAPEAWESTDIYQSVRSVAPPPRPTSALKRALVDALIELPDIGDFNFRSKLLRGLPYVESLQRETAVPVSDLKLIVDQLAALGQLRSGTWPLLLLADNARGMAPGKSSAKSLTAVYRRLQRLYGLV